MALVQNYVGLDARIYAIVRSLLNGESVDLSDYYTKAEVDALIASGGGSLTIDGGSLTIDYNNLINRPITNRESPSWYGWEMVKHKDGASNCLYLGSATDNCATIIYDPSDNHFALGLLNGGDNQMLKFNNDNTCTFTANVTAPNIYTKQECDEKFSGGGGGTTDYNQLSNRPIIDGLLQSNLDINNYLLLNNSEQLYLPKLVDDTVILITIYY